MQFGHILGRLRILSTSKSLTTTERRCTSAHRPRDIAALVPNKDNTSGSATTPWLPRPTRALCPNTHARHTRRKRDSVKCASFFHLHVSPLLTRRPILRAIPGAFFLWVRFPPGVDKGHQSPATQIRARDTMAINAREESWR